MQHKNITGADLHVPYAFTYADAAARTAATGFVAGDVGKLALQQDDNSLWSLTATTPTWNQVGTGAAPGSHTHVIDDVTGLQAALDAKAADADLDALATTVAGKADTGHNHDAAYAALGHTHTLDALSDVSAAGATDGQVLTAQGDGTFAFETPAGGGGGGSSNPTASVRQTVLSGAVDGNGFPNFLSAGTGLAVNLAATSVPVVIGFAAGFDTASPYGPTDYFGRVTADTSISSLTASSTCFLYADRDSGTGAITYGHSVLAPAYQSYAPSAPATDQHWFDLSTFTMKRWTGAAWETKQRVFLGEAVTNASAVTSVRTYALRGHYDSGWFSGASSTDYTKTHNLGMDPQHVLYHGLIKDTTNGNILPYHITPSADYDYNIAGSFAFWPSSGYANTFSFRTPTRLLSYLPAGGSAVVRTSADIRLILRRAW